MIRRRRCTVAVLVAALTPASALAAAAPMTGSYKGKTSQARTVSFSVGSHGGKLSNGKVGYSAKCSKSTNVLAGTLTVKSLISHGKFSSTGGFSENLGSGLTGQVLADLSGHFSSARKATGKLNVNIIVVDSNQKQVDDCQSGTVTFSAHR